MASGGFAAFAVVVIALAVVVVSQANMDEIEVKNMADASFPMRANIAGYLHYNNTRQIVEIEHLVAARRRYSSTKFNIAMYGSPILLSFFLEVRDEGESSEHYEFVYLTMSIAKKPRHKGWEEICEFDQDLAFSLPANLRYSCKKELSHRCSFNGEPVASLVLKSFELEFGGDPDQVAMKEFTKPAWEKSCDVWDA